MANFDTEPPRRKMTVKKLDDHFVFIYELQPSERCSNFRFDSTIFSTHDEAERIVSFSVWKNMLVLFYTTDIEAYPFHVLRERAHYFATTIVGCHAWLTGQPLELIRKNWVEVQGSIQKKVAGTFQTIGDPPNNHPDNEVFKKIVPLIPLSFANTPLVRALHDYHSCLSKVDPDFYFYAFRAVEDIRSYFGTEEDDKGRKKAWQRMNRALGRDQTDYKELVEFAKQTRHRNILGAVIDGETAQKHLRFVSSLIRAFTEYLSKPPHASKIDNKKDATTT